METHSTERGLKVSLLIVLASVPSVSVGGGGKGRGKRTEKEGGRGEEGETKKMREEGREREERDSCSILRAAAMSCQTDPLPVPAE